MPNHEMWTVSELILKKRGEGAGDENIPDFHIKYQKVGSDAWLHYADIVSRNTGDQHQAVSYVFDPPFAARTVMFYQDSGTKTVGRFDFVISRPIYPHITNFYLICQDRAVLDVVEKFVVTSDGATVDKWIGEVSDGNKFVCGFRSKVFEDGTSYLQGFYGFEIEFCELSCMAEKTQTAKDSDVF